MDLPKTTNNEDEDEEFFDAVDDFPFHDCISAESNQSSSESKVLPSTLRQSSFSQRRIKVNDSKKLAGEIRYKTRCNMKEKENNLTKSESTSDRVDSVQLGSGISEKKNDESTVTTENHERVGDSVDTHESPPSSSLLDWIVGLVIKAIAFQFHLLISFILFPFTVLYHSYMLIMDPFRVMKRGREYLLRRLYNLLNLIRGFVCSSISEWLTGHESIWKLVSRFGWGLFWAIYVCTIMCGLLIFSVVISGVIMRFLVEEPIHIKEMLNFDYTKNSPVAFVPIISCDGTFCDVNCEEKKELSRGLGSRVIPVHHKLHVTVKLTLPESDYNRKLGMFQVRVEFLSENGEKLSSSSHPCMLQFKSEPVRYLLTFFKVAPIVAGYVSETQTLTVKLRGFVERDVPTSCLKVMIEQRAEFQPAAGIPEIYDASLILESELPLFKRIIWYWRKTIFVWISMILLMMQLFIALVCCQPIILPRPGHREGGTARNSVPSQTQLRPPQLQQT